ncbi:MAG TPA: putative baseplate assembly protein, partial [Acidimicrobiales bacterium]|nr:putative baseplate assembly protein [Acidimicrobiales bacterium]
MALPAPNLDDRRFQDLVDEAKRLVQRRCPEWSDHNVSDPGVTLIETFAFMVDQLFYRMNRVPDLHYVKFLELIGVRQFPPVAARGSVTFWLSAPTPAAVNVAAGTEVTTLRTEVDEAVVFRVDEALPIVPCELLLMRSLTSARAADSRAAAMLDHHEAVMRGRREPGRPTTAPVSLAAFADVPAVGDALYVGLSDPVPRCAVAIRFECHIEGIGVDPTRPPLSWEAFDGRAWVPCEVDRDSTGGLNRDGDVVLHVPAGHEASVVDGERAGWLRAVITEAEADQPRYSSSPQIDSARAFTVGGTTSVVHAEQVALEILGTTRGVPEERFRFQHGPVVPGETAFTVEVAEGDGWETWTEVDDFAGSGRDDRHVVVDRRSGEVIFGPQVRQPDGTVAQYGAVPAKGSTVRVPAYWVGGGGKGNAARGAISILRSTIPFVSRVENRRSAAGGIDGETIDEAKVRGPIVLRTRDRAVTAEDYEHLARQAAPEVARVRCVPAGSGGGSAADGDGVRVLIVPAAGSDESNRLRFEQLIPPVGVLERVTAFLDERRTLGARLVVEPPHYQGVTAVVRIRARLRA